MDPGTGAGAIIGSMAYPGGSVAASALGWAPTETVGVDVKPNSDPNSINLKSKGVLPVAFLTEGDFDATSIDTSDLFSIRMGDVSLMEPNRVSPIRAAQDDVDDDGDLDLILHFSMREIDAAAAITPDTVEVEIVALSLSGSGPVIVTGTDAVRVVQSKGSAAKSASTDEAVALSRELQGALVDSALADLGERDAEPSGKQKAAKKALYDQLDEPVLLP